MPTHPLVLDVDPQPAPTRAVTDRPGPRRLGAVLLTVTLCAGLAACGTSASSGPSSSTTSTAAAGTTAVGAISVASSSLGSIVVDGKGRTLYMFTKDTSGSGASSCAGRCAQAWPAFTVEGTPTATGIKGDVGVLTTTDGKKQVTLGGWPLYYFAKDAAAGDVLGQDVGKVWFVLDPSGTPVTASPSAAPSVAPSVDTTSVDDNGGSNGGY